MTVHRKSLRPVLAALLLGLLARPSNALPDDPLARYVYPMAKQRPAPEVVIDTSDAPESQAWGETAKAVVTEWFPLVCQLLSTDNYEAPKKITLVFKKELSVPAMAGGGVITVHAKWIADHPDDIGCIVHELTHIVQSYPRSRTSPGWLVEGIADYVRWWRYEPEAPRTRIDPAKASYKDSYRVTAAFLAWLTQKYDKRLVPRLDKALRDRKDPLPVFQETTGKSVDDLWTEYVATIPPRRQS